MNHFDTPAFVRIIGFGDATVGPINLINGLDYDGIDAFVYDPEHPYMPTNEDRMVILLADSPSAALESTAKTSFEADMLTLGVFSGDPCRFSSQNFDSVSIISPANLFETVKSLLDSIILPAQLCFDLNDLRSTLSKTERFLIISASTPIADGLKGVLENLYGKLTAKQKESISEMAVLLTTDPEGKGQLTMSEVKHLSDFITELPDSIGLAWAMNTDCNLTPNTLKVTFILAGKEMPL